MLTRRRLFLGGLSFAAIGALASRAADAQSFSLLQSYGVFTVKDPTYGATGNGKMIVDGAISSSSATFTSVTANFTSSDVGKTICVPYAGTGGTRPLVTTISAFTNSTTVTLAASASATVSGAICHYGTDDTSAIQACITACFNAGGGIVFFPFGIYVVNGAFQNTGAQNAQLYIPNVAASPYVSITLLGIEVPGAFQVPANVVVGASPPNTSGSIIFSPRNGGSNAALMAAGAVGTFSIVEVTSVNLVYRTTYGTAAPPIALNLQFSSWAKVVGCYFDTDATSQQMTNIAPGSSGIGVVMPVTDNGAFSPIRDCYAIGYNVGFEWGEHCVCDNVQSYFCNTGHEISNCYHPAWGGRVSAWACNQGIYAPGTTVSGATKAPLIIDEFVTQHNTGASWYGSPTDVVDSNNAIYGKMTYNVVVAFTGYDNAAFTKTGGSNFTCTALF
jgi:hypothetical protein